MQIRTSLLLKVPLFVSLLLGFEQVMAAESTLADLRPGSMLVFTRNMELDTTDGTVTIGLNSRAFWNPGSEATCFFISKKGATSMVERGSAWRFVHAPRYGWNDYLTYLQSITDGRQLFMVCRKGPDEKIPLSTFLEGFNKDGLQVTPALR